MKNVPSSAPRAELRSFGLLMSGAFAAMGCLRWWIKGHSPAILLGIAIVLLVIGLAFPRALKPVYRAWMAFALGLNWFMTRALLSVSFYLFISPAGIVYRLVSGDPLKRQWDPEAATYWEPPDDQPADLEAYRNQF